MNKNLKFDEFNRAVVDSIKGFLPKSFANADISLNVVNKNNGLVLTGLVVRNIDSAVAPTIYLNEFFRKFENGMAFEEVMRSIAELRVSSEFEGTFDVDMITCFENCMDKIVPRLVNREYNDKLLLERPYTEVEDLAVTYHIQLTEDGSMSIPVTNAIMGSWNVRVEDLHKVAVSNMPDLVTSEFRSMIEIMSEVMGVSVEDLIDKGFAEENCMFVLSNKNKQFGSAALLDKKMMDKVVSQLGPVFILPSSVHECIIIADDGRMGASELREMVIEVNSNDVLPEEVLSNSVYYYSAEEGLRTA